MDFLIMNSMDFSILSTVMFLPLAGALVLLFIPGDTAAKNWALLVSIVTALVSLPLYWNFDQTTAKFQFAEHHPWIESLNINYTLGVDGITLLLIPSFYLILEDFRSLLGLKEKQLNGDENMVKGTTVKISP